MSRKKTIDDVAKAHAESHAADAREMDRLESEIKTLRDQIKASMAEVEDQRKTIGSLRDEIILWRKAYEGLEARLQIAKTSTTRKSGDVLSPLVMGAMGGLMGSFVGNYIKGKPNAG